MDNEQRDELAAQVKEARDRRGWSQARLAKEAGVAENTVMELEKGARAARKTQAGKVRLILDALDVPPALSFIDLADVPEDVRIFLTVATQRLRVMDEDDRNRVLSDLYPRLLIGR